MATTVGSMNAQGRTFFDSLSDSQKKRTCFPYLDGERIFWYYPPMNRHGLALRDMNQNQRDLAFNLMSTGLTDRSFKQAKQIIHLESVLGPLEKSQDIVNFERDPELYYVTIFGQPGDKDPWGWRVEGHHVSLHFSIWKDEVIAMTPFFFGANPAEIRQGPEKGLRVLGDREDIAFTLMESLDSMQRSKAIIYDEAPYDILTYNSSRVSLPAEEGLSLAKMTTAQVDIATSLIAEYVNQVATGLAREKLAQIHQNEMSNMHFAWGGSTKTGKPHYYRIHGGNFLVEYDNRQNGGNHIHSVWRDVENDFGLDIMREHLLLYHVL